MNLRNWTKQHSIGLLIGILTTAVAIPLTIVIYALLNKYEIENYFHRFSLNRIEKSKIISLASIANLLWFHTFLRQEKWPLAMGIILSTVLNLFAILYFKFLA
jgi:hypothetical protein